MKYCLMLGGERWGTRGDEVHSFSASSDEEAIKKGYSAFRSNCTVYDYVEVYKGDKEVLIAKYHLSECKAVLTRY